MTKENDHCSSCGMLVSGPAYHPLAACCIFKVTLNSKSADANLRAVVEYGMKAHALGVSLDDAMSNISHVVTVAKEHTNDPALEGLSGLT